LDKGSSSRFRGVLNRRRLQDSKEGPKDPTEGTDPEVGRPLDVSMGEKYKKGDTEKENASRILKLCKGL